MVAELWVLETGPGTYGICVRRASGDTFSFHAFYRQLRDAMAHVTGWSGSSYEGCTPGVPSDGVFGKYPAAGM